VGLKLNGTHDDVNLLADNIDIIKKNTETLIGASKEAGLEINVEKTKCMLLFDCQNASQNRDINIANISFENVSEFKYLGTTVTNQNLIQEEIKRGFNPGKVLYGCETWLLILREEHRLRVFENRGGGYLERGEMR
jgi:hypothetical protein